MTSPFDGFEVERQLRPSGQGLAFDLDRILSSVVVLHARVPADAFTAESLGPERLGNGIVIGNNGLVLTIDPLSRVPTLQQFLSESRGGIERRKGQISFAGPAQILQRQPTAIETLALDAEVPAENATRRATMVLAVIRDETAGATLAATLVTNDRNTLAREVERLAATIRIGKSK